MGSLFRGSLFAVACLVSLAPLATATLPDKQPKVAVEFRRTRRNRSRDTPRRQWKERRTRSTSPRRPI